MAEVALPVVPAVPEVTKFGLRSEAGKMPGELGQQGIGRSADIKDAQNDLLAGQLNLDATQRELDGYKGEIPSIVLQTAKEAVNGMAGLAERAGRSFEKSSLRRAALAEKHETYEMAKEEVRAKKGDTERQTRVLEAEAKAQGYNPDVIPPAQKEQAREPGFREKVSGWLRGRDRNLQGQAIRNAERMYDIAQRLRQFVAEKPKSDVEADLKAEVDRLKAELAAKQGVAGEARKGFEGLMTEGQAIAAGDRVYDLAQPVTAAGLANAEARTTTSTPVVTKIATGK